MNRFQDVFISYGRADSKFLAKKLNDRLIAQGLEVWFDFEDIPLGVNYQKQIDDGIEKADNFLFIISPHAVNSPYCALEVERALKQNKRIIPVLHIEQISHEIWQQRFPQGTAQQWESYQSQGKHSSFPNMHPEICKINWVYCREGVDDFEQSLQDLLAIFERDRVYVRQHTAFLAKALEWQHHHHEPQYLLIREERQQAETWLKTRFQDRQPPCIPTDLHCEFITESTKNANNLMTQVFISWARDDRALMEQFRRSLLRENLTVWVSKTDIQTGADFQQEINHGIEEADNVVYLISPAALKSPDCQQEIQYALSLNKRIIPLLIRFTDLNLIPSELRSLHFINFADNTTQAQHERDVAKLIKILNQDAGYYEEHKILLTKALKWDRQHRNPSILLRGYNLRHAEAWLKVAHHREQHHPIPLIEEFIQESLRQPEGVPLDVFVSYSRKDSEFARRLNDALQIHGKTTWFDQENIAAGSPDFQQEIYRGIENSDHFLFIISPSSIGSPYCFGEVDYATRLNKRIITVLAESVKLESLPPALATVQWIDFSRHDSAFDASFSTLLRTLDTDPEHLRTHTRLLVRALEWENRDRDESLLLRGSSLKEIQQWLLASPHKNPQPTRLQRDYVTASNATEIQRQRATLRLQRVGLGLISVASLAAIALGLTAYRQYQAANRSRIEAQKERIWAQTRTSEALFRSERPFEALLEAMHAGIEFKQFGIADDKLKSTVVTALQQAVFWVQENQRIGAHAGIIWDVDTSPDTKFIASASDDGSVKIWNQDGTLVNQIRSQQNDAFMAVAFSPNQQLLAVGGSSRNGTQGQAFLVRLGDKQQRILLGRQLAPVVGIAFSPNGQTIATASEDSMVRLWNVNGKLLKTLEGHNAPVRSVTFSPDGQLIATASDDRTIRLWSQNGTPIKTLIGHTAQVRSVSFSRDGKHLVSASWDETVRLWNRDGTPIRAIAGHGSLVNDAKFSQDGKTIASAGWDKTIKLWTLNGTLITSLPGHSAQIRNLSFSHRDGLLLSAGGDRVIRRWTLNRPLLATLQAHWARVYSVSFSPDDQILASAGADNTIHLWDRQGNPLRQLKGHQGIVWSVGFSPDSKLLASASSDHTIKLWNRNGQLLKTLVGHAGPVHSVKFSPDGNLLVSAGADQTVRLWRRDGLLIRILQNFNRGLLSASFSPNGRSLAVSGWDNTVQLMTLQGKVITQLKGHQGWVYSVMFSRNGKHLLTASYDGTAKIWSQDGHLVQTLRGHEDGVVAAVFSHDERFIATASYDGTVKLWKQDGRLITTLRGHRDRVSDVSFSQDGNLLATASEDQTVLLWKFAIQGELDKLLARSCEWTHDYLQTHAQILTEIQTFCKTQPQ
ncbi:WD40 repeat-containing protein [Leptolyngbyaceae cyanobacterium JSC-12]|nr:WD40 repeat-containing protein [Leptolyngbyaceae cyanobacterium JSC-12]